MGYETTWDTMGARIEDVFDMLRDPRLLWGARARGPGQLLRALPEGSEVVGVGTRFEMQDAAFHGRTLLIELREVRRPDSLAMRLWWAGSEDTGVDLDYRLERDRDYFDDVPRVEVHERGSFLSPPASADTRTLLRPVWQPARPRSLPGRAYRALRPVDRRRARDLADWIEGWAGADFGPLRVRAGE